MICRECKKAKRYAIGSMYCLLYGIIIDEKHEGSLKGCEEDYGDFEEETGDRFGLGEEWPED